jgi:hypothetical protein
MAHDRARAAGRTAAVLAAYALLAVVVLRPTPWQLAHTAPAFHGVTNDALLLTWAMDHVSRTIFVDPLHLFDAPIFHPARLTLAYSDHMIGQALVGLPIWLATGNPLLEYNLLVLASYVLGGAATFAYARALGTGVLGAFAAGLVFAFNPYRSRRSGSRSCSRRSCRSRCWRGSASSARGRSARGSRGWRAGSSTASWGCTSRSTSRS